MGGGVLGTKMVSAGTLDITWLTDSPWMWDKKNKAAWDRWAKYRAAIAFFLYIILERGYTIQAVKFNNEDFTLHEFIRTLIIRAR